MKPKLAGYIALDNAQERGYGELFDQKNLGGGVKDGDMCERPSRQNESSGSSAQDICENYHLGNPQSVEANKLAKKRKESNKYVIFCILRQHPCTCEELEEWTGLSHQTCSARCSDLKREGKIKESGRTRLTRGGCPAAVLIAV